MRIMSGFGVFHQPGREGLWLTLKSDIQEIHMPPSGGGRSTYLTIFGEGACPPDFMRSCPAYVVFPRIRGERGQYYVKVNAIFS